MLWEEYKYTKYHEYLSESYIYKSIFQIKINIVFLNYRE